MTRSSLLAATAGTIATINVATSPARADDDSVRNAISSANLKFVDALKRADAIGVTSLFASDATIVAPGSFVVGHDAIASYYTKRFATRKYLDGSVTSTSVTVSGEMASELGTYTFTIDVDGQPRATFTGHYLTMWRKQNDGVWLISADAPILDPPLKT